MSDSKERFSSRADDYARARPSYPPDIVAAILEGFHQPSVADIGAGTGISSILLANAGASVYAVEPNAKMRAEIASDERIHIVDGSAERTRLADASVDIATAFQGYHWFDPLVFFTELNRITKSKARFAAIWNHRDREDALTGEFERIVDAYDNTYGQLDADRRKGVGQNDVPTAVWHDLRIVKATHAKRFDWDGIVSLVRSMSYLPHEGPTYDAMLNAFRALFDDVSNNGAIELAYVTQAHLADR